MVLAGQSIVVEGLIESVTGLRKHILEACEGFTGAEHSVHLLFGDHRTTFDRGGGLDSLRVRLRGTHRLFLTASLKTASGTGTAVKLLTERLALASALARGFAGLLEHLLHLFHLGELLRKLLAGLRGGLAPLALLAHLLGCLGELLQFLLRQFLSLDQLLEILLLLFGQLLGLLHRLLKSFLVVGKLRIEAGLTQRVLQTRTVVGQLLQLIGERLELLRHRRSLGLGKRSTFELLLDRFEFPGGLGKISTRQRLHQFGRLPLLGGFEIAQRLTHGFHRLRHFTTGEVLQLALQLRHPLQRVTLLLLHGPIRVHRLLRLEFLEQSGQLFAKFRLLLDGGHDLLHVLAGPNAGLDGPGAVRFRRCHQIRLPQKAGQHHAKHESGDGPPMGGHLGAPGASKHLAGLGIVGGRDAVGLRRLRDGIRTVAAVPGGRQSVIESHAIIDGRREPIVARSALPPAEADIKQQQSEESAPEPPPVEDRLGGQSFDDRQQPRHARQHNARTYRPQDRSLISTASTSNGDQTFNGIHRDDLGSGIRLPHSIPRRLDGCEIAVGARITPRSPPPEGLSSGARRPGPRFRFQSSTERPRLRRR